MNENKLVASTSPETETVTISRMMKQCTNRKEHILPVLIVEIYRYANSKLSEKKWTAQPDTLIPRFFRTVIQKGIQIQKKKHILKCYTC